MMEEHLEKLIEEFEKCKDPQSDSSGFYKTVEEMRLRIRYDEDDGK